VSGEGDAWFVALPLDAKAKGSVHLKAAQAAVDAAIADETVEGTRKPLPAFPPPDKPRKQVGARLGSGLGFGFGLGFGLGIRHLHPHRA